MSSSNSIIIAFNLTGSPITLRQLSLTLPASGGGGINLTDYATVSEVQDDLELFELVSSGSVVVNDGTRELNQAESLNYISTITTTGDSTDILTLKLDGTIIGTGKTILNFVGDGVSASVDGVLDDQINIAVSGSPTGDAGGDLSGTYPNPSVIGFIGMTCLMDNFFVSQAQL